MREDSTPTEAPLVLATAPAVGAPAPAVGAPAPADRAVTLPRVSIDLRARLPRVRVSLGPRSGIAAIGVLGVCALAIVATAAAGPSILVPRSVQTFPGWEAGPLHYLAARLILNPQTLGLAFSAVLVLMLVAYGVALAALRSLSMRTIAIAVVALNLIMLLSPPMQLTDLFNYLGYARLGGLHALNPYAHGIRPETFDPVYRFSSWHNLRSPYGPLFTALTYPLAFVSLPAAYWIFKLVTVALSLTFVWLTYVCARRLGRDPRFAVAFVALNPIFVVYEVGGFHNDFFMLVPMMGSIALMLARRDRTAGAVLMLAVAVKVTAILLLPFLLVAAVTRRRRLNVLLGAVLGALPLAALSVSLFGLSLPNLAQQSALLTSFSIPNLFGDLLHIGGGSPTLLRVATVCVVLVVAHQFYRNRDWLAGAGWATLALIASLGWLMPWYVIWLLPLAALGTSVWLRRLAAVLTVYLLLTFLPATALYMADHGVNLLQSPAGQASLSLQNKLSQ